MSGGGRAWQPVQAWRTTFSSADGEGVAGACGAGCVRASVTTRVTAQAVAVRGRAAFNPSDYRPGAATRIPSHAPEADPRGGGLPPRRRGDRARPAPARPGGRAPTAPPGP